ncbi:hypothetical protein BDF22DRAFT_779112 [Syncephalis plumigaleata]|nr:hypothetical protein BDF22DRAFT_779112 [Syncephalis plumigaleata]
MHFNMNIISITTVAALLLASIESAESMGLFSNKVVYQGETISGKGALGLPKLELLEVPDEQGPVHYLEGKWDGKPAIVTCADLNQPLGRAVKFFYDRHTLPDYPGTVDPQAREGAKYLGNVVAAPSKFGKQCYVIDNACKYTYNQYTKNLSKKGFKKQSSLDKTINQIVQAVKYVQTKGLLYDFSSENMCFDANENLLMRRHYRTLPLDGTSLHQRSEANTDIHNSIFYLEWEVNGPVNDESIYHEVKRITRPILYPESPSSSPSGSRRNSISGSRRSSMSSTDTLPQYNSQRNSPSGSRRNSISDIALPPQQNP